MNTLFFNLQGADMSENINNVRVVQEEILKESTQPGSVPKFMKYLML